MWSITWVLVGFDATAWAREAQVCGTCEFATVEAAAADPLVHLIRLGPGIHLGQVDHAGPFLEIVGHPSGSTLTCDEATGSTVALRSGRLILRDLEITPCAAGRGVSVPDFGSAYLSEVRFASAPSAAPVHGRGLFIGERANAQMVGGAFLAQDAQTAKGGHVHAAVSAGFVAFGVDFQSGRASEGGSIRGESSAGLLLEDCTFTDNRAIGSPGHGGSISTHGGDLTIWNTSFSAGVGQAGAIYSWIGANLRTGTEVLDHGGGPPVVVETGAVNVVGASFERNNGGGITLTRASGNPTPTVVAHSSFRANRGPAFDLGFRDRADSMVFEGNLIENQSVNGNTSGLKFTQAAPIRLTGNTFQGNRQSGCGTPHGGGVVTFNGFTTLLNIEHNRFCDNVCTNTSTAGQMLFDKGGATLTRNVFFGPGHIQGMHDAVLRFDNNTFVNVGKAANYYDRNTGYTHHNLFVFANAPPASVFTRTEVSSNPPQTFNLLPPGVALYGWAANDASTVSADASDTLVTPKSGWACESDFRPQPSSPAVDAGSTFVRDPDFTPLDIGAFTPQDGDNDGSPFGVDCDDASRFRAPALSERCNGIDDDCDGQVDEDGALDARTFYLDLDEDGAGDSAQSVTACHRPPGYARAGGDCDDEDARAFTGHPEVCDGVDNDCDGQSDEPDSLDAPLWYADLDGDGFGDADDSVRACQRPGGRVALAGDCDDGNPNVSPEDTERCNGIDDDCDGEVDDEDASLDLNSASSFFVDADDDGFGRDEGPTRACLAPPGTVSAGGDCDDGRASVFPGAEETCDGLDGDCDGLIDEDAIDPVRWFADVDDDGFGDPDASALACSAPAAHVSDDTDCDDSDGAVHPGSVELCNGLDDDCDGAIDEGDAAPTPWYADADGDGLAAADAEAVFACEPPSGHVADNTDCDDEDPDVGGPPCPGPVDTDSDSDSESDSGDSDTDTGDSDSGDSDTDTGDSDTGDSDTSDSDTGDASDSVETDTSDSSDTSDTSDTSEIEDSDSDDTGVERRPIAQLTGGAGCGCRVDAPAASGAWIVGLTAFFARRRRG